MFLGVKRAYTLLFLYIMEVIEELGSQPAFDILMKAVEKQGEMIAKEIKTQIPAELSLLEVGAEVYRLFMVDVGSEVSIYKKNEKSITFLIHRCPFHEAYLDVGVDCGIFLKGLCSSFTVPAIQATLMQFDNRLRIENLVTRDSSEGVCLERVYLMDTP